MAKKTLTKAKRKELKRFLKIANPAVDYHEGTDSVDWPFTTGNIEAEIKEAVRNGELRPSEAALASDYIQRKQLPKVKRWYYELRADFRAVPLDKIVALVDELEEANAKR